MVLFLRLGIDLEELKTQIGATEETEFRKSGKLSRRQKMQRASHFTVATPLDPTQGGEEGDSLGLE